MRRCRENLPNRCCHLTSRFVRRAFEGGQAANRRNLGSVPSRWLGGSVVRWFGSCANPQPETHTSRPENEGLVPKAPILKYRIILAGRANIMQIACAVAGSVPRFSVFKEGRSPAVFKEAQALMDIDQEKWGPMVGNCRDKGRTVVGGVRWANAVPFGGHSVNVVECSQLEASDDAGAYYGQFATDLDVNNARRAVEIARWGRLRWVIENSFKTQKRKGEDGFGLEHAFCKDGHASLAAHMLMQLAHNLWQVFESGIVRNLSKGVSRPTQSLWAKKLCEALHYYDFSEMEIVTVYLNHEYERSLATE